MVDQVKPLDFFFILSLSFEEVGKLFLKLKD